MEKRTRQSLGIGLILILLGAWFLAAQLLPGFGDWVQSLYAQFDWPLIVVAVGGLLLLLGLVLGVPDLAVPACIVAGIGGLLYWQNATGNWESWAYAWALIPGFVGVGVFISALLKGEMRSGLREGGWLVLLSLAMFLGFGLFLGGSDLLRPYWPVALIAFGVWVLFQPMLRSRN